MRVRIVPRWVAGTLRAIAGGLLLLVAWLVLTPAAPVAAATQHVTNCTDTGVSGDGSLRGEIAVAAANDTITFSLDCTGGSAIMLRSTVALATNLTIDGTGHTVVLDGGCTFNGTTCTGGGARPFQVNSGVTASLTNLTIQHGNAIGGDGGGIANFGGTLTLTNSTITGNTASNFGGGIANESGTLTLTNSTIIGNSAGNTGGGGIHNFATLTVTNSTITGNAIGNSGFGGGILTAGGTVTLTNTIIAANTAAVAPDIFGTVTTPDHNLLSSTSGTTGITNGDAHGDIVSTTPLLGPLGANGGPTQTISLLAGSPAIGAGDATVCANTSGTAPVAGKDQRGLTRPASGACAIGAFEPQQTTYTVGSTSDSGAMDTFADCQTQGNTTCKLRDALAYASSGSDTINFNASGQGTITLNTPNGGLTLAASVTLAGPTSGTGVIVDGGCTFSNGACQSGGVRVFAVNSGVTASLSNLTIQHGNTASIGGGGILNQGTLSVTNSTLAGNSSSQGGGILVSAGTLTLTNSTLTGNTTATSGGGLYNASTMTVTNSTLAGNTATTSGGGIFNFSGSTATLTNTIVATNTAPTGPDVDGTITSGGHNLIGNTSGSTGITGGTNGDIVNNTPLLGALSSNGGPTETIPLLSGSPAIGAGDPSAAGCASTGASGVNDKDQRGVRRSTAVCDIGAFEAAKTYTVGSMSDSGAAGAAAACLSGTNTSCRLRDAIGYGVTGQDTVVFNSSGRGTITLNAGSGTLTLAASVTISGPTSGAGVTVDGGCTVNGSGDCIAGGVTVFTVNAVVVSISNLTIQHGNSTTLGSGGILSGGNLTLASSTLTHNATNGVGGAIGVTAGTLTVTNSTFTGNTSSGDIGGVGGAIGVGNGTVTVTNSTFTGNSASNSHLTNPGGGIATIHGAVTINNTIVATSTGGDLRVITDGSFTGGHNLIDDAATAGGMTDGTTGNSVGHPALLGTLGANGGPTQTISLLVGSPAIAHGDPAVCTQTGAGKVNTLDQRGVTRPTGLCAIGAYEPLLSAIAQTGGPIAGGVTVTLTGAGYTAGAAVTLGGVACTNVQIVASTALTCVTGAHAAGVVDVVVTVNSQTGTLTGGYTYGVVNPLPAPQSPGPANSSPNALPVTRPAGPANGTTPNPLPVPRQ